MARVFTTEFRERVIEQESALISNVTGMLRPTPKSSAGITDALQSDRSYAPIKERILDTIVLFEGRFQKKEYTKLYEDIRDGFSTLDMGTQEVKMEYAKRLFNAALKDKEYAIALQAYELIEFFSNFSNRQVPTAISDAGKRLYQKFGEVVIKLLNIAPKTTLKDFGLTSPEKLDAMAPYIDYCE